MEISEIWSNLYSHNPKLQAFAVSEETKIVWQTDNWDLVDSIETILDVFSNNKSNLKVADVSYTTVRVTEDSYIATSDKKGHFLMAKANHRNDTWLLAWAKPDTDMDLTIIDLMYAATKLPGF